MFVTLHAAWYDTKLAKPLMEVYSKQVWKDVLIRFWKETVV